LKEITKFLIILVGLKKNNKAKFGLALSTIVALLVTLLKDTHLPILPMSTVLSGGEPQSTRYLWGSQKLDQVGLVGPRNVSFT